MNKITKKLCVLQVTPEKPNNDHVNFFKDKKDCDFFFVTHDAPNEDAIQYCPNTTWVDTRNILADLVPKQYEYYAFVDYDFIFSPQKNLSVLDQICHDLDETNPAVLTYYPGPGFITPFNKDKTFFEKHEYSIIPFTHCGMKVIHHSLMDWFFPMITRFGGGVEACHFFNIQELPFLNNVVCSHNMIYDNAVTDMETPHNKDGAWSKYRMDQSWEWLMPAFKQNFLLKKFGNSNNAAGFMWDQESACFRATGGDPRYILDSLDIKNVFIEIAKLRGLVPERAQKKDNYYDTSRIEKIFDLSHEYFSNKHLSLSEQLLEVDDEFEKQIQNVLRDKVTYETLSSKKNPWYGIVDDVNKSLPKKRNITITECHEAFQKMKDNQSIFYKNSFLNEDLKKYLNGKTVALVGPAPYLIGKNRGSIIDDHDVVVRIQPEIFSPEDYGSRTDISFADFKKQHNVSKEWALYWETYTKKHIEKLKLNYTPYSSDLNSGYIICNELLAYPIKCLSVFGIDFYNFGNSLKIEDRYNPKYIEQKEQHSDSDVVLCDILAQAMHMKNILLKDSRFCYDKELLEILLSDSFASRIEKFKKLPRLNNLQAQ